VAAYSAGLAAVTGYAWWVTGLRPFSGATTVAVVGAGMVAMAIGLTIRSTGGSTSVLPGYAGWVVLFAAVAVWQVLAFVQHPRSEHPTLSSLVNSVIDTHPARTAAFVGWLVAGMVLARR